MYPLKINSMDVISKTNLKVKIRYELSMTSGPLSLRKNLTIMPNLKGRPIFFKTILLCCDTAYAALYSLPPATSVPLFFPGWEQVTIFSRNKGPMV